MTTDQIIDRTSIIDTIVRLFVSTDQRDWKAVEACFAPEVHFDMTSLAGGEPERLTPARIASGWSEGLAPIEAIHHQAGNFQVEPGAHDATATCYAIALHYRRVASGRNTRTFVGSYDFHLVRGASGGWRIDPVSYTHLR
ncbi:MAG: nuclear transport factor 2 family protein, partial [Candidatus Eisenbacteria bacterium]|nr:nuclear transport factor 2 family protein [Candidatus Eisenbacteria bacterium]